MADLDALEATGAHGPWIDSRRISIRAGLAALDERPADALGLYVDALRRFRDLGVALDEALTAIEMATLLDPALPEVRAAAAGARETLVRLGARPFLDRLNAAMSRGTTPGSPMGTSDRGPDSASIAAFYAPAQ